MKKYLLDTNVLIGCLRKKQSLIDSVLENGKQNKLAISTLTYGELLVGLMKNNTPRRRNALSKVLTPIQIIDYDQSAAKEFSKIKANLESNGKPIGAYDMQIAAHAISLNYTLVTHNTKEFSRIPKLKYTDWE